MSKKLKSDIINVAYHSASSVHNYLLNDPLTDWLNIIHPVKEEDESKFITYIKNKGVSFESEVVEVIKRKVEQAGEKFVQISNNREEIKLVSKYEETVDCINKGVAVIYQGVLHGNDKFKAYGSPDLIVRSNIINLFIDNPPKCNDPYVTIDIKYHTLKFTADKKTLLNEGRIPTFKGQIIVYNILLGIIMWLNI